MGRRKYTKELLEEAVRDADPVSDVLRNLGLPLAGGSHAHVSRRLKEYEIDTSHFTRRRLAAKNHYRTDPQTLLIKRGPPIARTKGPALARALRECGRAYVCELCGLTDSWQGVSLTLQVDHIDGDLSNNAGANLRFLCPNCHSQCDTFSRRRPKADGSLTA